MQLLLFHDYWKWGSRLNLRPTVAFSEKFREPLVIIFRSFPLGLSPTPGSTVLIPAWRTKAGCQHSKLNLRRRLEVFSTGCVINHSMSSTMPLYSISKDLFRYLLQRVTSKPWKSWGRGSHLGMRSKERNSFKKVPLSSVWFCLSTSLTPSSRSSAADSSWAF